MPGAERNASLDLEDLIPKEEELQRAAIQRVPGGFLHRLSKVGELPGFAAKMRYLFHIFFPTRENLFWRYGPSADKALLSHYLFHLSYIGKRFFNGVCLLFYGIVKGCHRPQRPSPLYRDILNHQAAEIISRASTGVDAGTGIE